MESCSSSSSERPQSSELFICFTSRLSSSMKISSSSSSSSASKSNILSPGRAQISLSSSLSRRLRTSGSLKGQASPMFPAAAAASAKKRSGCASSFDTPEPSSPKVTCIGQVRVKTKMQSGKSKKKKKIARSRSSSTHQRRMTSSSAAGEASFRRPAATSENAMLAQELNINSNNGNTDTNNSTSRNQNNRYWVHQLPVTICEALRDFNCFLPCRSSCAAGERKRSAAESGSSGGGNGGRSCGAVFARWLVAVQDGDGKGREIELVVGEEDEEEQKKEIRSGSQRRRVFEGIEFKDLEAMATAAKEEAGGGEEAARVSLCVPPKNALLLMRCRSDPVKMAALASRFWESPAPKKDEDENDKNDGDDEDGEGDDRGGDGRGDIKEEVGGEAEVVVDNEGEGVESTTSEKCLVVSGICGDVKEEQASLVVEEEEEKVGNGNVEKEDNHGGFLEKESEEEVKAKNDEFDDDDVKEVKDGDFEGEEREEKKGERELEVMQFVEEAEFSGSVTETSADRDGKVELVNEIEHGFDPEYQEELGLVKRDEEMKRNKSVDCLESEQEPAKEEDVKVKVVQAESTEEEEETRVESEPEETGPVDPIPKVERESQSQGSAGLPDCLLLMMCEPKLSMEVSKETWVCSTDFIRWLPERRRPPNNPKPGPEQPDKNKPGLATKPATAGDNGGPDRARNAHQPLLQPPRSSCSFPAVASGVEHKLAPYEPFVLTRCKSEPMRSAAKLAAPPPPPPCFWKNRKLEPHHHRPAATLGVGVGVGGAAGVGF